MTTDTITPYRAQIPDVDLEYLRTRLARVRWPDEVTEAGWDYGVPIAYVRDLADRWRNGFDWHHKSDPGWPVFSTFWTNQASVCTSATILVC